jgi:amine acid ABC transporter, permease protein, 3-TM region, His/Glu/Gln/Arg/opine family
VWEYLPQIIKYTPVTLKIVLISVLIGVLLGIVIAGFRIYQIPVLNNISKLYISFIRGTPVNIQLYVVYFGIPALLSPFFEQFGLNINRVNAMFFVIITYSLNNSAFLAELFRASVLGVEHGQVEAAYSIGMTKTQTFRRIIIPQAAQIAIPDFGNIFVNLLKNTSLAYALGIIDIMGIVAVIGTRTHRTLEGYVASAIVYFILSTVVEQIFSAIQKKTVAQV